MPNPVAYMLNTYESQGISIPAADLLAAYAQGPADLVAAVAGLSDEQLRAKPIAGKWSILQVVGHLSDSDQFLADRMKRVIALERPLLIGVDENQYMAAFDYHLRDLLEELKLLALTRSQMTRILSVLPSAAWMRQAVHTEAGLMTLHQILFHATYHIQHHLPFILEKRRAMGCEI